MKPLPRRAARTALSTVVLALAGMIPGALPSTSAAATSPPAPSPLTCQSTPDQTVQCGTGGDAPAFRLGFDFIFDNDRSNAIQRAEPSPTGGFAYSGPPGCGNLTLKASPTPAGLRLSVQGSCAAPVQLCLNLQAAGPDLRLKSGIAYAQARGGAIGIQADERFGTNIDPSKKLIRLCTNPVRQNKLEGSVDLFAGSPDEVKKAFQSLRAPIRSHNGELIGYAKTDPVERDGYLFIDLTEHNADSVLAYARQSGFPYLLIYASTWAASLGSYDFNRKNYPNGLAGLQKVVRAANAQGIKIGLHMLTSFVGKNDPLVPRRAADALLKDDRSATLQKIDASTTAIAAADALNTFPTQPAFYGNAKAGLDLLIDSEIISCPTIQKGERGIFTDCKRGLYGTTASAHEAGAPIHHLAERYGSYLIDQRSGLRSELAGRIGGLIDEAGIDMIYFDGGEVGSANGDAGWYVAEQQIEILRKVHRPLLVEGSGIVPRLWPWLTRIVDDDFAALAPITYLDEHKIGRVKKARDDIFMPDNLGWIGYLKETPAYPATTPEDIATSIARSLALERPLSIETYVDSFAANPYTPRLLDALGAGNRALRGQTVSAADRSLLGSGLWYYHADAGGPALWQYRPVTARQHNGAANSASAGNDEKQLVLRVRNIRRTAADDAANPVLLGTARTLPRPPAITAANRGLLAESITLQKNNATTMTSAFVDFIDKATGKTALDLSGARTMRVDFDYTGTDRPGDAPACNVLNLQLQDNRAQYRDYLLELRPGTGQRATLDYETAAPAILKEFFPAGSSYAFKAAVYGFNFNAITRLNLRWMSACGADGTVTLRKVSMLREQPASLKAVTLKVAGRSYPVADAVATGETLDVNPDGSLSRCRGGQCSTTRINWPAGTNLAGRKLSVEYAGDAGAEVTLGLLGARVAMGGER